MLLTVKGYAKTSCLSFPNAGVNPSDDSVSYIMFRIWEIILGTEANIK